MKPTLLILMASLCACYTYQSFVTVKPRTDVPQGATEFRVHSDITSIKNALRGNTILITDNEFGFETQEILLDEGTRARYTVVILDTATVRVVPYWGYTDKVKSETSLWLGYAATSTMSNEMTRVIYKTSSVRPKRVFDYGVQIFGEAGMVSYVKGPTN